MESEPLWKNNNIQNKIEIGIPNSKHKCTHTKIGHQKQKYRNHVNEKYEQLRKEILNQRIA